MDDQIKRVLEALEKKGMRDNTLVMFQSDNGGTRNAMFAGEGDMSKVKIPCDNGPYRDGKGSLCEGGTRVIALANWRGRIQPGSVVNEMIHVVDMYPTLVKLAGGSTAKCKPLDGLDVWETISAGKPSPRTELVYNIESFRGSVRQSDWKLIWRTPLPSRVELFNIANDPSETNNLATAHPEKVVGLQKRIDALAGEMTKSLVLQKEFEELLKRLAVPPALPGEEFEFNQEP
jgi:arylsulfatase A-like enzyme